jgi:hypothetical protein
MFDEAEAADEIQGLEARIEALAESIEKCRKISFTSKLTIAAGAVWLALMMIGAAPFGPAGLVVSIAAMIGGLVLAGSNSATWEQADAERRRAEARRTELIDSLHLTPVGDQRRIN